MIETTSKILGLFIVAVIFSFWQPDWLYPAQEQPWYWGWFLGGFHGSIAPFTWIMSFFTDNIVKLHNQGACYGFFWWVSLIGIIIQLIIFAIACGIKKFMK